MNKNRYYLIGILLSFTIFTLFASIPSSEASTQTVLMTDVAPKDQANSWKPLNTADKLAAVVSDDVGLDASTIERQTNSKRQCFTPQGVGASGGNVESVTLFGNASKNQPKPTDLQLDFAKGDAIRNQDISHGDKIKITKLGAEFQNVTRYTDTNPFTGVAWTLDEINNWELADGTPIFVCVNNQQNQNIGLRVSYFSVLVVLPDSTPPVITADYPVPDGNHGWNINNVTLDWTVTDDESEFVIDSGCIDQEISDSTETEYQCQATSEGGTTIEGGTIIDPVLIKVDTSPPVITMPQSPDVIQAPTEDGSTVDLEFEPFATDTISEIFTFGCTDQDDIALPSVLIGHVFPIGFTTITCEATNFAGLTAANTIEFDVVSQVNPFIEIIPSNPDSVFAGLGDEIELNAIAAVRVADPWINRADQGGPVDHIFVLINSTSQTPGSAQEITLRLNATAEDGDVYVGQFRPALFDTNEDLSIVDIPILHANNGNVTAVYPFPDGNRTSTIEVKVTEDAQGGNSLESSDLKWENDVYALGTGGILKSNLGSCTPELSRTVNVFSPADTIGIDVLLLPDKVNGCTYTSESIIYFTTTTSNSTTPSLEVKTYKNAKALDADNNFAATYIVPQPFSMPTGGTAFDGVGLECGAGNDNDNDGLCNDWEQGPAGLVIEYGNVTYNFPCKPLISDSRFIKGKGVQIVEDCVGPDPDHKDLYFELDFQWRHNPSRDTLVMVRDVFLDAPVSNPDNEDGINIHLHVDENTNDHQQYLTLTDFYASKTNSFGTVDERDDTDGNASDRITAKRQAFHWQYWVHSQDANKLSSGYAELAGQDSMISMGAFSGHTGTTKQQAQTTVHEIAHNLHVNHGGGTTDTQACKPNYISQANYLYQLDPFGTGNPIDLSRTASVIIDEANPDEEGGIPAALGRGNVPLTMVYGPNNQFADKGMKKVLLDVNKPIDWDRDGEINNTSTESSNINRAPYPGCKNNDGYPTIDSYAGFDDWNLIETVGLHFRQTASFADGVSSLDPLDPNGLADQGNLEFNSTDVPILPIGTSRPMADASATNNIGNEGDIRYLDASQSDDADTGIAADNAEPPGIMWNINYDDNPNMYDDQLFDAVGNLSPIFLDDDESGAVSPSEGVFRIGLRVNDDHGNQNLVDTFVDITILNVAPVVTAGADPVPIDEGGFIDLATSTFEDPGIYDCGNNTCSATINWGQVGDSNEAATLTYANGTLPVFDPVTKTVTSNPINTTGTVLGTTHTYLDDDEDDLYFVNVTVTDKDFETGYDLFTVTVNNVDPVVTAGDAPPAAVDEGTEVIFDQWSFTDLGILDTHTATVDYGDGNVTAINGGLDVISPLTIPAHTYSNDIGSPFIVNVTVTDDDLGSHSATLEVIVNNIPPVVTAGADYGILFGETASISANFTDADGDTHTATVDYGDGIIIDIDGGADVISPLAIPDLTYEHPGNYTVTITVSDGTDSDSDTQTVTVDLPLDELDDPIAAPVDNRQYKQGANVPFKVQFLDASDPPVPIDSLLVEVWIDVENDGREAYEATSNKRNVSGNIAKYSNNGDNYQFALSTAAEHIIVEPDAITIVHVIARVIAGDGSTYAEWSNSIKLES